MEYLELLVLALAPTSMIDRDVKAELLRKKIVELVELRKEEKA